MRAGWVYGMFLFVLLLVLVTGYGVSLLHSWGPLYRANLFVHPALALGLGVYIYRYSRNRLEVHDARFSRRRWVDLPTALVVLIPMLGWAKPSVAEGFALLFMGITALFLLGASRLAALERRVWYRSAVLLGYLVYAIWSLLLFSGLSALMMGQAGGIPHIFERHKVLAHVFAGLFVVFLVLVHWRKARGLNLVERVKINWRRTPAALLGAWALLGVIWIYESSHRRATVAVDVSRVPVHQRPEGQRQGSISLPEVPSEVLSLTDSCGGASGCHQDLVDQLKASNHALGLQTPHSQKILALMREEVGSDSFPTCAGCHAPPALADATKDADYFATHHNMACTSCHLMTDVSFAADGHSARYHLDFPMRHIALFLDDEGKERPLDALTAAQVRLSPLNHGRMFTRDLHRTDDLCRACHHQEIPADDAIGLAPPRCVSCHMQPGDAIGFEGTDKNHFWAGANPAVPHFAKHEESEQRIRDWIDGEYILTFPGWDNFWELREGMDAEAHKSFWILMKYETLSKATAGETLKLRIISSNVGPMHPIPASPLDLAEMWLELEIRDASGQVLMRTGQLDEEGRIPAEARRLGGRFLFKDGTPLDRHRVWRPHLSQIQKQLMPGDHRFDTFEVPVPELAGGFIEVVGGWYYRKLSREFTNWAYGPDTEIPVVKIGEMSARIVLRPAQSTRLAPLRRP